MTLSQIFTVKEFTGRHMLIVMICFFGVIITANMTMAWYASQSWSGLVAKNGYVESINFKDRQAAFESQQLLGWRSKLTVRSGQIVFSVKDAQGNAVTGLEIVTQLGRPATEKSDTSVSFREANPGEYLTTAPQQVGQWLVEINATGKNGQTFRKKYRFLVDVDK